VSGVDDAAGNVRPTLHDGVVPDVHPALVEGPGKAVQVDPIKPTLKAPGSMLLKLRYDGPLSEFAFNFNLRRYNPECGDNVCVAPNEFPGSGGAG